MQQSNYRAWATNWRIWYCTWKRVDHGSVTSHSNQIRGVEVDTQLDIKIYYCSLARVIGAVAAPFAVFLDVTFFVFFFFFWGGGVIFTLHHGRSRVASFRFTCPHPQVDFHSKSSPVDSPADIFIHSSFLFLFFPERGNRNACYPRCPPRNSVRRLQKTKKKIKNRRSLEQFVTFCPPHPPPLAAENYEQWAALTFLHSQVRRRLRSRPGPMAHREALSYLSPAGQWRALPGSHDASLCSPSPLSARSRRVRASLKTWHRRNRTSAVLGRI